MHQTIGDILRVVLHTNPPQNMDDANQVMDNTLATSMHATRCVVSAPSWTTPGALVYGRDMIMDVLLIANLSAIWDSRQQMIDENLIKQNKKRIEHHYQVGDRVKQIVWNKLSCIFAGNSRGTWKFPQFRRERVPQSSPVI